MPEILSGLAPVVLLFAAWCAVLWFVVRPYFARRAALDVVEHLATAARIVLTTPPHTAGTERSVALRIDRSAAPVLVYTAIHRDDDDDDTRSISDWVCLCDECRRDNSPRQLTAKFKRAVARVNRTIDRLDKLRNAPTDPRDN
jgi:hypothetical protein